MNKTLLAVVGMSMLAASAYAEAGVAGHFQFVAGEVKVSAADGKERLAVKGVAVSEGESVNTATGASAQIKMVDEGLIVVRPDSSLRITKFLYSGKTDGSERSLISLLKGGFRAITGLIGRVNKDNYKIETPGATIGIRGTDHEPTFIPNPLPGQVAIAEPGTYDKVNSGAAVLSTANGLVVINPNQAGFVPNLPNAIPTILAAIPAFYKTTAGKDEPKVIPQGGERMKEGKDASAQSIAGKDDVGISSAGKTEKSDAKIGSSGETRLKEKSGASLLQPLAGQESAADPAAGKADATVSSSRAGGLSGSRIVKGVADPTITAAPISKDTGLTTGNQTAIGAVPVSPTPATIAPVLSATKLLSPAAIAPSVAPTTIAPAPTTVTPVTSIIAPTTKVLPATITPIIAPMITPLAPAPVTPVTSIIAPTTKVLPATITPIIAPTIAPVAPAPTTVTPVVPPVPVTTNVAPVTTIQLKTISPLTTFSDRRLKKNIVRIGTHPLGFGIYEFDYVWGEHAVGVIADEVEFVRPEAVLRDSSGYDMVDYSKLN